MKKIILTLTGLLATALVFSQTGVVSSLPTGKIVLANGQKIFVESSVTIEANLSPGMDMNNKTSSFNTLEVKTTTDSSYTISNTVTKLKLDMDMMGQSSSYDSDKKEDQESEIGKSFADKINKSQDVIIGKNTGKSLQDKKNTKKADDVSNPADGLLGMFAQSTDDAAVSGAFELIPAGKKVGDKWSDSTIDKASKLVRVFTLKSIADNEATIQMNMVMDATNTIEQQGMSMEFTSTTKTMGDIITDITTGKVKSRVTVADISGTVQVMGQSVPITAKANSTSTYK
jgi:hypothetical protein